MGKRGESKTDPRHPKNTVTIHRIVILQHAGALAPRIESTITVYPA